MATRSLPGRESPEFTEALEALRHVRLRPEVRITEVPAPQRIAPYAVALTADVIDAMTYPVEGGTARYVGRNLGRPAAGKTGTSESFRSAWFNGYVPQLETAVGMFMDEGGTPVAMTDIPGYENGITGGTIPVRIWTDYMRAATEGMEKLRFPEPAYINRDAAPKQTQRPRTTEDDSSTNQPRPTTQRPTSSAPEPTPTPTPCFWCSSGPAGASR